jgi:uncharacterized protein (DUF1697 family)
MAMTDRMVALLRGINVGKAKRIAMADLRAVVEGLGFTDVRTLLNSGNVILTAPGVAPSEVASRIQAAVEERLGVSSRVRVVTGEDLDAIVAENPLGEVATNHSRLFVTILFSPDDVKRLGDVAARDWSPEALAVGSRATYAWLPDGSIDSAVMAALGKVLGDGVTTRNWSTIQKLHALVHGE